MDMKEILKIIDGQLCFHAKKMAKTKKWEFEDAKQELILKFLEVFFEYDETKGQLTTFASTVFRNHSVTLYKKTLKQKRKINYETDYYDFEDDFHVAYKFIADTDIRTDLHTMKLTRLQQLICEDILQGKKQKYVTKDNKISTFKYYQELKKLQPKLKYLISF